MKWYDPAFYKVREHSWSKPHAVGQLLLFRTLEASLPALHASALSALLPRADLQTPFHSVVGGGRRQLTFYVSRLPRTREYLHISCYTQGSLPGCLAWKLTASNSRTLWSLWYFLAQGWENSLKRKKTESSFYYRGNPKSTPAHCLTLHLPKHSLINLTNSRTPNAPGQPCFVLATYKLEPQKREL